MPGAIVQEKWAATTSTDHCTVSFTSTVTAGSTLVCFGFQGSGGVTSVSDSVNGSWAAGIRAATPGIAGRVLNVFVLEGTNNAGGTISVTATIAGGANGCNAYIAEISGCTSTAYAAALGAAQSSQSGATDAITTGALTFSGTCFCLALSHHLGAAGAVTSAGTGWTAGGSGWPNGSNGSRSEYKVTSTSTQTATFTNATDTTNQFSLIVALTETSAATQTPYMRDQIAPASWNDQPPPPFQGTRSLVWYSAPPAPDGPPPKSRAQDVALRAWWETDVQVPQRAPRSLAWATPPVVTSVPFSRAAMGPIAAWYAPDEWMTPKEGAGGAGSLPGPIGEPPPAGWPARVAALSQYARAWEPDPVVIRPRASSSLGFRPTTIAGCKLWLRADLGVTIDGSNQILTWADQSGNGNDATQSTPSSAPILTTDAALNNQACASSNAIRTMTGAANVVASGAARTVFIVCRNNGDAAGGPFQFKTTTPYFQCAWAPVGSVPWSIYTDGSSNTQVIQCFEFDTIPVIYETTWDGNTSHDVTSRVLGQPLGVSHFSGSGTTSDTGTTGYQLFSTYSGKIAEVIVYDSVLSASDALTVRQYLAARYALGLVDQPQPIGDNQVNVNIARRSWDPLPENPQLPRRTVPSSGPTPDAPPVGWPGRAGALQARGWDAVDWPAQRRGQAPQTTPTPDAPPVGWPGRLVALQEGRAWDVTDWTQPARPQAPPGSSADPPPLGWPNRVSGLTARAWDVTDWPATARPFAPQSQPSATAPPVGWSQRVAMLAEVRALWEPSLDRWDAPARRLPQSGPVPQAPPIGFPRWLAMRHIVDLWEPPPPLPQQLARSGIDKPVPVFAALKPPFAAVLGAVSLTVDTGAVVLSVAGDT